MSHPEHDDLRRLRRVLGPAGPELTCEQCFEELDRYVEAELAGIRAELAALRRSLTVDRPGPSG